MAWIEVTTVDQREEFVSLAMNAQTPFSELCRRFQVSRKTGYKWLARAKEAGDGRWAEDRSRRPHHSPAQCSEEIEHLILGVRREHPAWGARKIRRRLEDLGHRGLPAPSTITAILHRAREIDPLASKAHRPLTRFEYEEPNLLWQMDFKGPVAIRQKRAHPLTVIDDHSRYALCIKALANQQESGVREALTETFRRYGMPHRLLADNGACWGAACASEHTRLTVWLLRLGITMIHGRPYHPQTQGKNERFNRTLKAEALSGRHFASMEDLQGTLDTARRIYNEERPHEALSMAVPASRYTLSPLVFPETLPPIEYLSGDLVRVVTASGSISIGGRFYTIGRGFYGERVALRETRTDGLYDAYLGAHRISRINLGKPLYAKYERKRNRSGGPCPPRNHPLPPTDDV